ncbi:hypothetical protein ACJX0J_017080, partial [Zea mays]
LENMYQCFKVECIKGEWILIFATVYLYWDQNNHKQFFIEFTLSLLLFWYMFLKRTGTFFLKKLDFSTGSLLEPHKLKPRSKVLSMLFLLHILKKELTQTGKRPLATVGIMFSHR